MTQTFQNNLFVYTTEHVRISYSLVNKSLFIENLLENTSQQILRIQSRLMNKTLILLLDVGERRIGIFIISVTEQISNELRNSLYFDKKGFYL